MSPGSARRVQSVHRQKPSVWSRGMPLLLQLVGHSQVCQYFFRLSSCGETVLGTVLSSCCSQHPCCFCSVLSLLLPVSWHLLSLPYWKQESKGHLHESVVFGQIVHHPGRQLRGVSPKQLPKGAQAACITDPEKRRGIWSSHRCSLGANHSFTYYRSEPPSRACSLSG